VSWNWDDQGNPSGFQLDTVIGAVTVMDTPTGPQRPYAFVLGNDDQLWLNWWSWSLGTITGLITDDLGYPIDYVSVEVTAADGSYVDLDTDVAGRYTTPPLAPGVYDISVGGGPFVLADAQVTVLQGVPTTTQNFALMPTLPFIVEGTVTGTGGAPVAGATLDLTQDVAGVGTEVEATTDANGDYSLTWPPDSYNGTYTIRVSATGFIVSYINIGPIPNGATIIQNIALVAFGTISGRVSDTHGAGIGGAAVAAGSASATTDSTGHYSLTMLTPDSYKMTVSAWGFQTSPQVSITVSPGATVQEDFVLTDAIRGAIAGEVTVIQDGDTWPLSGATVSVGPLSTQSDANGNYTLANIPSGSVEVSVTAPHCDDLQQSVYVVGGQTDTGWNFTLYSNRPPHPPFV
jgi:hypothetical protein